MRQVALKRRVVRFVFVSRAPGCVAHVETSKPIKALTLKSVFVLSSAVFVGQRRHGLTPLMCLRLLVLYWQPSDWCGWMVD